MFADCPIFGRWQRILAEAQCTVIFIGRHNNHYYDVTIGWSKIAAWRNTIN